MTTVRKPIDWDADVAVDDKEVYESLVRAIARTEGFGLFFVRCVEKDRAKLEQRLKEDLPALRFERLELREEMKDGNLYQRVAEVSHQSGPLNGLFISGLEKSLDPYVKSGYGGLGDYYNKDMVPRLLGHLNLQRERFRDDFSFCLIFFLSAFGIKYIARRAPDFFDWRSGLFEFLADAAELDKLTQELLWGNYDEYLTWTETQRLDRIREIQTLIDEDRQTSSGKTILFLQKAGILVANQSYEEVITSLDKIIELKSDEEYLVWQVRGQILNFLNRYEEALISYEKAFTSYNNVLGFKFSTLHPVWYDYGNVLSNLTRYEEAITSYDKSIELKLDDHEAWHNRGNALSNLNRYEEAIASYDKAIEYKPDSYKTLTNRGNALSNLTRYEEAIASYDKAIEYKPDDNIAWYNRAYVLALKGEINLAFADLTEAFRLNPEESRKLAIADPDLEFLREDPRFEKLLA
jgi:tetratricopeptide (TPR) repeat protein